MTLLEKRLSDYNLNSLAPVEEFSPFFKMNLTNIYRQWQGSPKKELRAKIFASVKNGQDLDTIKLALMACLKISKFSFPTENYVEYKFFKYCRHHLQPDLLKSLEQLSDSLAKDTAREICDAKTLSDLPPIIQRSIYFKLILNDEHLLSDLDKLRIFHIIRGDVAKALKIVLKSRANDEVNKVAKYGQVLKKSLTQVYSGMVQSNGYPLHSKEDSMLIWLWYESAHPDLATKYLKSATEYERELATLKTEIDNGAVFAETEKSVQNEVLKPLVIKVERAILTAEKPVMLLSTVVPQIEKHFETRSEIQEVRFYASEAIFIDCSLTNTKWHGKNVLVASRKVECIVPSLVWDLSGLSGQSAANSEADNGTGKNLDGRDGADGFPGESGGNCAIFATIRANLDFLTITSNGGNGGKGQHGGHGHKGSDGKDGKSISLERLENEFVAPATVRGSPRRENAAANIIYEMVNCEEMWSDRIDVRTGNWDTSVMRLGSYGYYIKGFLRDGLHIEHGLYVCNKIGYFTRHSYTLVKGSPGEPGGLGGQGGLGGAGGQGGFPGILTVSNFNGASLVSSGNQNESAVFYGVNGSNGERGNRGKIGPSGKSGQNGQDVGYVDSMRRKEPLIYSGGNFNLQFLDKKSDNSVWCIRHGRWRNIEPTKAPPLIQILPRRRLPREARPTVTSSRKNPINVSQIREDWKKSWLGIADTEFAQLDQSLEDIISEAHTLKLKMSTKGEMNSEGQIIRILSFSKKKTSSKQTKSQLHDDFSFKSTLGEHLRQEKLKHFKTLEIHQRHTTPTWEHQGKLKIEYVKHPTSTKGNDSGFHALFGEVRGKHGVYEAEPRVRQRVCDFVKSKVPFTSMPKVTQHLEASLEAFFDDDSTSRSKSRFPVLNAWFEIYSRGHNHFDWSTLLKDEIALREYFDHLAMPSTPLLISDLRLIAEVHGISLAMYMCCDNGLVYAPLEVLPSKFSVEMTHVCVEEHDLQFSRMVPVTTLDRSEVSAKMWSKVGETMNLITLADMEANFGNPNRKHANYGDETVRKMVMIKDISEHIQEHDERLYVEAAMTSWAFLLVHSFHDRIEVEENGLSKDVFTTMFTQINDVIIGGRGNTEEIASILWTVAAYPVEEWMRELCLICGENYFVQVAWNDISVWRSLLEKIPSKLLLRLVKLIEDGSEFEKSGKVRFTKFLEAISKLDLCNSMNFDQLEGMSTSEWVYHLHKLAIASKLEKLPNVAWDDRGNKRQQALYFLQSLYNGNEKEVTAFLTQLQETLAKQSIETKEITWIFGCFYGGRWDLNFSAVADLKGSASLEQWIDKMNRASARRKVRSLGDIVKLMQQNSNSTLTPPEIDEIVKHVKQLSQFEDICKSFSLWLSGFNERVKQSETDASLELQIEAVAAVDFVLKEKLSYHLRPTQKVAIMSALHLGTQNRNLLSQIATGEGKTCIVLCIAIVRALFGDTVDVVTSSGVLAQRDAKNFKSIYHAFGLTVGDVTSEKQEDRSVAYRCDVVYGEASHFQRDYLLDHFYNQNIRGSRPFGKVIVDEVDSMFLDKGNSVLYLSHQPPDLDSLEPVLIFIWTNVVRAVKSNCFHPSQIKELVASALYHKISTFDLSLFLPEDRISGMWNWLVSSEVIDNNARFVVSTFAQCEEIFQRLPQQYKDVKKRALHIIKARLTAPGRLPVMRYLLPFVEQHLESWVNSAFQATQLTDGKEYIVDVDRSKTVLDKNPHITILDLDTGVDLTGSQWNEGLHQFLQLKHGCRLSPLSLKAVFISNISYFKMYSRIFGLSGTMGTESDRNFLKGTYGIDFLCVPLAQSKRFIEEEPQICQDGAEWKASILEEAITKVKKGRSVLIICGTVRDAEAIYGYFKAQKIQHNVELYRRDYETFRAAEEGQVLPPREIIIATNLSGRGTNISLSPELRENGGLHVILSYLPDNLRVEQQAFGRAARCGDPGSGRLIFIDTISGEGETDAITLKNIRDDLEIQRVAEIEAYYRGVIAEEESMFQEFQESFEGLTTALANTYRTLLSKTRDSLADKKALEKLVAGQASELRELIMYSMLDDWAFWLDRYSSALLHSKEAHNIFDQDVQRQKRQFSDMIGRYEDVSSEYTKDRKESILAKLAATLGRREVIEEDALEVIHEPGLLVKVAKVFIKRKMYSKAEKYLKAVVTAEPDHCHVALYYQLLCRLKDWNTEEFRGMANRVLVFLDEYRYFHAYFARLICQIGNEVNKEDAVLSDGYEKQKNNVITLLDMFRSSIDDLIGHDLILPAHFQALGPENLGVALCNKFVEKGVLNEAVIVEIDDKVKVLARKFCLDVANVSEVFKEMDGRKWNQTAEVEMMTKLELPSRDDFWREISGCLEDVQSFAAVQSTNGDLASQKSQIGSLGAVNNIVDVSKPYVFKYGIGIDSNVVLEPGTREELLKQQRFRYLSKLSLVSFEEVGCVNIQKLEVLQLTKFLKIKSDAFTAIEDIDDEAAQRIFRILVAHQIIDDGGELLSARFGQPKLNLGREFEVYRTDILRILHSKCRYKYELLSLLEQVAQNQHALRVNLPTRPFQSIVSAAIDLGLIRGRQVNATQLKNIFKKDTSKLLTWFHGETEPKEGSQLLRSRLATIFPQDTEATLDELYKELEVRNWVSSSGNVILNFADFENLPQKFRYHEGDILEAIDLEERLRSGDLIKGALKILTKARGKLVTLENPDSKIIELWKAFEGDPNKTDYLEDIHTFTLSGFGHVIDSLEEKYTRKMIFSTVGVTTLAAVQLAVGVSFITYVPGFGNLIGKALIGQAFGDFLYLAGALRSGYFSWSDWAEEKSWSVLWSAVTCCVAIGQMGQVLDAVFGSPVFDGVGMAIAENSDKTTQSAMEVVMKNFCKQFVKNSASEMKTRTITFMLQTTMEKSIYKFSTTLLEKSSADLGGHGVVGTLTTLVEQFGVAEAEQVVELCNDRVVASVFGNRVHQLFAEQLPLMNAALKRSIEDGVSAQDSSSDGTSDVYLHILKMSMEALSSAKIISEVVPKLREHVTLYLSEVEKEIQKEIIQRMAGRENLKMEISEEEKVAFLHNFRSRTKELLRKQVLQRNLIEPLTNKGRQKLIRSLEAGVWRKLPNFGELFQTSLEGDVGNGKTKPNLETDKDYSMRKHQAQLAQLCRLTNDSNVIAYVVEFGGMVGPECLPALATLLRVQIVLESSEGLISKLFKPVNGVKPRGTLNLKQISKGRHRVCHWEASLSRDGHFAKDCSLNSLFNAANSELKGRFDIISEVSLKELASFIRNDVYFQDYIRNGFHQSANHQTYKERTGRIQHEDIERTGFEAEGLARLLKFQKEDLKEKGLLLPSALTRQTTIPVSKIPITLKASNYQYNVTSDDNTSEEIAVFQSGVVRVDSVIGFGVGEGRNENNCFARIGGVICDPVINLHGFQSSTNKDTRFVKEIIGEIVFNVLSANKKTGCRIEYTWKFYEGNMPIGSRYVCCLEFIFDGTGNQRQRKVCVIRNPPKSRRKRMKWGCIRRLVLNVSKFRLES